MRGDKFYHICVPNNCHLDLSRFNISELKLRPDRHLLRTLFFLLIAFFISGISLFLSFLLKYVNPTEYGMIQGNKNDLEITYREILFFVTIVFCFFLLSLSFRYIKNRVARLSLVTLMLLYLFLSCLIITLDVGHLLIFTCRMNFSAIQTILNTNPEEVKGFIKLYYSPGTLAALLTLIAFLILVIWQRKRLERFFSTSSFFVMTLVFSLIGIADFAQLAHSKGNGPHNVRYWDIVIGEYNEYREFNRRLEAEKNQHLLSGEYDGFRNLDTLHKTFVFVISESLSKRHMSLYGYARPTTPKLDANKDLIKFNDCVTHAAMTIDAVPALFFNGNWKKRINLIALLNKLGYHTSWISNQSGWGKGDRTIVLLSQLSKQASFMDATADNDRANLSQHYDETVLEPFEKAMRSHTDKSRFIVLHLMACHFDYEKRYPPARSFFKTKSPAKIAVSNPRIDAVINTYDNAVLYHDSVMNEILNVFTKHSQNKNAALIFISDHGEELYENRDHAGHGFPPGKTTSEIPYFVVLSENFKKNYPLLEKTVYARVNTSYSTINNFYTLLHFLNISSRKHQARILKNGFFSPIYDSTAPRLVMGLDYAAMER